MSTIYIITNCQGHVNVLDSIQVQEMQEAQPNKEKVIDVSENIKSTVLTHPESLKSEHQDVLFRNEIFYDPIIFLVVGVA